MKLLKVSSIVFIVLMIGYSPLLTLNASASYDQNKMKKITNRVCPFGQINKRNSWKTNQPMATGTMNSNEILLFKPCFEERDIPNGTSHTITTEAKKLAYICMYLIPPEEQKALITVSKKATTVINSPFLDACNLIADEIGPTSPITPPIVKEALAAFSESCGMPSFIKSLIEGIPNNTDSRDKLMTYIQNYRDVSAETPCQ